MPQTNTLIHTINWDNLFDNSVVNINFLYNEWFIKIICIAKEFNPFLEVLIRPRNKPWTTSSIRAAMRKQDRLLRKFRASQSLTEWNKYKSQRNLTVGIIRKEKILYFTKLNSTLRDPKLSTKNWWKAVKSVYDAKASNSTTKRR